MQHKLSIGMPVYDGERSLEQAVEPIPGQTYSGFELILSGNASTDSSPQICQRLACRDRRSQLVRHAQNTRAAANSNRVSLLARGEYFKWACADDLAEPWLVERSVAAPDSWPDVVLCHPKAMHIDESNNPIRGYAPELTSDDVAERFPAASSRSGSLNALQAVMRLSALRATPLSQSANASETHEPRQKDLDAKTRGTFASGWRRHGWERSQTVHHAPPFQGLELRRRGRLKGECYWHRDITVQKARHAMSYLLTTGRRPA